MHKLDRFVSLPLVVVILIAALIACGESTSAGSTNSSVTPTQAPQGQPTTTKSTYLHFGDGTFVVGKDIHPGTYRTRVASPNCYYARLKGFGGSVDDIIANENTDFPAIVTIAATDKGFQSENCGTWTKM